jgi:hypothetical protein
MVVYYVCEWSGVSGGIRVLYDHVRTLRSLGVDARLASRGTFERCVWFRHDAEETPAAENFLPQATANDVIVVPEILLDDPAWRTTPAACFAFVQNLSLVPAHVAWRRFARVLTASAPLAARLRAEGVGAATASAVPHYLEPALVGPARAWTPAAHPCVLLNPRRGKHRNEPYLAARTLEDSGLAVRIVDGLMHRDDYVRLFREHSLYLHLSRPEGFPGPVMEAFGAGCLVVGFTGGGGDEFMRHERNCLVAPDGDWRAAVALARSTLRRPAAELTALLADARATALRYDETRFRARLGAIFAAAPVA